MTKQHRFPDGTTDKTIAAVVKAAIGSAAMLGCVLTTAGAGAAVLVNEPVIEATIEVTDTAIRDNGLRSVIRNTSDKRIDAVDLVVRYDWVWKDERNPGHNNPGWVEFITLTEDLKPGDTTRFTYNSQRPLPQREDGWFMPSVQVVGFTPYEQR